ncbi:hypothetical protein KDL01_21220 [Actinospica durhamensis]|uniref:Uncharacterized protein n=1 Tax=Actinospica durhamensis TaxID=1508375 RepID=A0A941ERG4_9ACTN|nr:hypothetical protein [Actinospica durhamensis]MBR7835808.1 hypothetical protein [Actinospica durhamensis]
MSMDIHELEAESAELLPGREALGKLSFSFTKTLDVTKNVTVHNATVNAGNSSNVGNFFSPGAVAQGEADQTISITQ